MRVHKRLLEENDGSGFALLTPCMKALLLIFSLLVCSLPVFGSQAALKSQIQSGFQPDFLSRDKAAWISDVQKFATSQLSDGTWSDVNYSAVDSQDFAPKTHLSRAATMAEGYGTPGQIHFQSKTLLPKIRAALKHWLSNDYQSYNWWHNQIGVQQYIVRILVLTGDHIGGELKTGAAAILDRTVIDQTGQNRMWRSEIVFVRGVLYGKNDDAKSASKEIEGLLVFDSKEGIQSDGSFLQHGNLIYNGGYGDKFIQLMARYMAMVDGSHFDFHKTSKQRFIDHVLKAQLWLTRNNKYDYGVMGRSLTVKNRTAIFLGSACETLSRMKVKEKIELQNCAQSVLGNKVSGLVGNKAFYRSDTAVQQEKDYYASVRMYSTRTVNNDAPSNGEGLMSHHLSEGAMLLMKDGSEYENIFPVWDWNKIPGTTVEQKEIVPAIFTPGRWDLFEHMWYMGFSQFVGSVSNGRFGASAFNFVSNPKYDKLSAKKSWFFFDKTIWALGSNITCPDCEKVQTTVNQTLSKGEVKEISSDVIMHQNVGYLFPANQEFRFTNKLQKGNWNTINSSLKSEPVSEKVFTLTLNHGKGPMGASYEYLILPETSETELKSYDIQSEFSFLNSSSVQAVYSKKQNLLQAAFYEKSSFKLEGLTVEADGACLIMIENVNGRLVLHVSDPTQQLKNVTLRVNGLTFQGVYPTGIKAGSTLTL